MQTIMIVDDEPQITQMLEKALGRNPNWKLVSFNNPVTALAQLSSIKPDLVLLDIMMPHQPCH